MIAIFALGAEPGAWDQPEDGGEVAQAGDGRGSKDRAEGPSLHDFDRSRGGSGRRVPASHVATAGRLPLRIAAVDPASDTVSAAPLPATPWHLPSAGHRRRKPKRQRFKRYPIGFIHVDIAEVQTAEGKLYLFVGIDRTIKFAVTQLVDRLTGGRLGNSWNTF